MRNMNDIAQIGEVYDHLYDDESKKIFENRLLYSLTGDYKFLGNIGFERQKNFASVLKENENNIVIFGAAKLGHRFLTFLNNIKITAFCDRDEEKQKELYYGYKVISPQELKEKYNNAIIVIAVWGKETIADIKNNLLNMGFGEHQIWIFRQKLNDYEYFEPDLIIPNDEEFFIDAGCHDCDTAIQFVKWCRNKYKKIIAFEPNPKQYQICMENSENINNITIHPYGLWDENNELDFVGGGGNAHTYGG